MKRDDYIAQGKCPACREHAPLAEGRKMCPDCLIKYRGYANRNYAAKRAMGRCQLCSARARPGRIMCAQCAARINANQIERYWTAKGAAKNGTL